METIQRKYIGIYQKDNQGERRCDHSHYPTGPFILGKNGQRHISENIGKESQKDKMRKLQRVEEKWRIRPGFVRNEREISERQEQEKHGIHQEKVEACLQKRTSTHNIII